ncbi:hypothetical protein A8L45_00250 [Veronia pacifica]|uniref:HTH marR-type domain-containing protein n=2 Tax=Veronia pacifica TaxID=1080227 RepID=A0A1C3ESX2_9GAMM|nr:hypothetical protein A8L45_00250 [Veronia pacifica]
MDMQNSIGSLCRLIGMKTSHRFHEILSTQGINLTPEQIFVIYSIGKSGQLHQSELIELIYFASEKSKISRIVQSLVEADLINRHEDTQDRRAKVLSLTESGTKVNTMLNQITHKSIDFYRSIMTDDELLHLQNTLKKVLNAL